MTPTRRRGILCALAALSAVVALASACGKYGRPVRSGPSTSAAGGAEPPRSGGADPEDREEGDR